MSIAKTTSKKIGAMICSMKFLSPEVALYLNKSTIWSCMECCCHAWRDFSVAISRCYKNVCVNVFFPHTVRLWNSLPKENFPLTYYLNGAKSSINRHLVTVGSF